MKKLLSIGVALTAFATTSFAQFNEATLNQSGQHNRGEVFQRGINHDATINQSGNGSSSQFNRAVVNQENTDQNITVNQSGHGHTLNSFQRGLSNNATFTQLQANTEVFSRQTGQNNLINSTQASADGTAARVEFVQEGNRNNAQLVLQVDVVNGVGISQTTMRQIGNDNTANLVQTGDANTAGVFQTNNWNYAIGTQSGVGNRLEMRQQGSPSEAAQNRTVVNQSGNFNQAMTYQEGVRNRINLEQSGAGNNYADLKQIGSDHQVRGTGGSLFARQTGLGSNRLESTQTGTAQTLYVNQNGFMNQGVVMQSN